MSSSNQVKTRRRRTFSESKLNNKNDSGIILSSEMKMKSLSSTLNIISKNDRVTESYDSVEDLNKEIEKLSDSISVTMSMSSRFYCDIFSRQSIESENSSPDVDDERINFLASIPIPDHGCEIIQLIPKKPSTTAVIPNAIYQPCTNIQKILKSSCSAFRDISEFKIIKSQTDSKDNDDKVSEENREVIINATSFPSTANDGGGDESTSSQV